MTDARGANPFPAVQTDIFAAEVGGGRMVSEWTPDQGARRAAVERGGTVVANYHHDALLIAWAKQRGVLVYIGRAVPKLGLKGSIWHNAHRLRRPGDERERLLAVTAYERDLDHRLDLVALLPTLRGRVLMCFCYPLACHGDVIARRVNALGTDK
jgi:Domain of unknown function (DUF4326)